MKKFVFLLFLVPFFVLAQNNEDLFTGGIEIGLIGSQIDGDYNVGYHKISPTFGTYADLWLNKKLALRSGVYYMPKGARSGQKYTFFVTRLNYAEIPFFATYYFNDFVSASLGLCFDYLFSGYYYDGVLKVDYKELGLRSFDLAHYWSLNIKVSKKLTIRFVQNYSLLPISKVLSRTCWYDNMFFYWMFKNVPPQHCWWNNVLKISFDWQLF